VASTDRRQGRQICQFRLISFAQLSGIGRGQLDLDIIWIAECQHNDAQITAQVFDFSQPDAAFLEQAGSLLKFGLISSLRRSISALICENNSLTMVSSFLCLKSSWLSRGLTFPTRNTGIHVEEKRFFHAAIALKPA